MQKYQDVVLGQNGRPVVGATVTVTTLAGAAATIYSDNGTTVITSLRTGDDGSFAFYAADGRYSIQISGSGITTKTLTDILLEDPIDRWASVTDFGADATGVADSTAAFAAAMAALPNGGVVQVPPGYFYLASSVTIGPNITLQGPCESIGSSRGSYVNEFSTVSSLRLSNTATLNLSRGSVVCNLLIVNANLLPLLPFANVAAGLAAVAAYAGTAINGSSVEDTYIHNCRILGFAQAIKTDLCDRVKVEWLDIDCTAGIWTNDVYDIPRIYQVHMWPFVTYGYSFSTQSLLYYRSGSGFKLTGHFDAGTISDSFAYGYSTGFDVQCTTGLLLQGCWVEGGGASYIAGQAGYKFTVAGDQTNMLGCGVDTCDVGVLVNYSGIKLGITGCMIHANRIGIEVDLAVDVTINDNHFYYPHAAGGGSPTAWITPVAAIYLNGVAGQVSVTSNYVFGSTATPGLYVTGTYANNLQVIGNKFISCTYGVFTDTNVTGEATITGNSFNATTTPYSFNSQTFINRLTLHSNIGMAANALGNLYPNLLGQPASTDSAFGGASGPRHVNNYATGTPAAPAIVASGNGLMSYRAFGYDGAAFQAAGLTRISVDGAPAAGSMPGTHIVSTTPSGAVTPIDRNATNNAGHFYPLVDNAYTLGAGASFRWSVVWAATATISTSDARTKKDIADSSLGLSFINALRPVSYRFKVGSNEVVRQVYLDADGNEIPEGQTIPEDATPGRIIVNEKPGTRTHWGLISQEVKATCDALGVDFGGHILADRDDPDSEQGLRYEEFIAPLIKAVQELSARVQALESHP